MSADLRSKRPNITFQWVARLREMMLKLTTTWNTKFTYIPHVSSSVAFETVISVIKRYLAVKKIPHSCLKRGLD
jgi:hypothetical protein